MKRLSIFSFGAFSYAVFFASFLYTAGFLSNLFVSKTIDGGEPGPVGYAVAVNLALLSLFAIQHSGMARPAFKEIWTRIIPASIERATYVLLSSLVLITVIVYWEPIGGTLWHFESGAGYAIGLTLFSVGLGVVLYSTMLIDHFELFGLRQVFEVLMQKSPKEDDFVTPSLYRYVRHPLYVGWFITLWATPSMTVGHLLFASVCTAYILVAVQLEERDLANTFGNRYRQYQASTPMFIPRGQSTSQPGEAVTTAAA